MSHVAVGLNLVEHQMCWPLRGHVGYVIAWLIIVRRPQKYFSSNVVEIQIMTGEEVYTPLPKCRPLRWPRHFLGLGVRVSISFGLDAF